MVGLVGRLGCARDGRDTLVPSGSLGVLMARRTNGTCGTLQHGVCVYVCMGSVCAHGARVCVRCVRVYAWLVVAGLLAICCE